MKHIILLLTLLLATQFYFAQEKLSTEKVQIGLPYPVIDAPVKRYFNYKDLVIAIKIDKKKKFILQTYSSTKLTLEKIKVYEDFPKNYQVEEFVVLKDRIFLFYSSWDKPNLKEQLFVREINPTKCSFIGKGKLVLDVKGKVTGSMYRKGFYNVEVRDKFDCLSSFDESRLLIQYRKRPKLKNDSKSKDVIGFKIFNENIDLIWGKEITMPYTEKKMNNIDHTIDSEGNVYVLAEIYRDNTTKLITKDKKINYDMELLKFEANTGNLSKKKITLKTGKVITSLRLFESGNNIVFAGYYSSGGKNGKDFSAINGIVKFNLEKGDEDFKIKYYDIPIEIINQNLSERDIKKKKKKEKEKAALAHLTPETFYISSDGSIVLIGEQQYTITHTYTDSKGHTHSSTIYYYNDVLITKINKDGSLAWMKKLAKRQTGNRGRGGMSFKLIEGNDGIYLVYLDNIKNLDLGLIEVPAYHRDGAGGFLTAFKINYNTGNVKKISLLDTRNVKEMRIY